MSLEFSTNFSAWILIVFISSGFLIYWFSRHLFNWLSPSIAAGIIGLRILIAAFLSLILIEPVLQFLTTRAERPNLAVLIDTSASMGVNESSGNRHEKLTAILSNQSFTSIQNTHTIQSYSFSEEIKPILDFGTDSLKTEGTSTNIGKVLTFLKTENTGNSFDAAILISDGNSTLGRDPLRVAQDLEIPIYTIGIGDTTAARGISITHLNTNYFAYVNSKVPVEIGVAGHGFNKMSFPVTIKENDRVLQTAQISFDGSGREETVVMNIIPETPGVHHYVVEIPSLDGEAILQDNQFSFAIKALKSNLRILYIEGAPRSEMGFIKRALEKDANLETTSLIFRPDGTTFPSLMPSSRMEWFSYDLIVLGSIKYDRIRPWVPSIKAFVEERGGGLIALGGQHSFEMGGYTGTPISNMMPFQISKTTKGMIAGEINLILSPDGRTHPITKLDADPVRSEEIWKELPTLSMMNHVGPPKPGATILATNQNSKDGIPIILYHRYGQGKVLAIAALGLWQWDLMTSKNNTTNIAYERFWNNAARWMAVRENSRKIRVETNKTHYFSGETVLFEGQIYDDAYRPIDQADLSVIVRPKTNGPSDFLQLELTSTEMGYGRYRGQLKSLPTGEYRFVSEAKLKEISLGSDNGIFTVGTSSREFKNNHMNKEFLTRLANMTGGQFFLPVEINQLERKLPLEKNIVQETRTLSWWNHPATLILLIILLTTEWVIRRYLGVF